MRRTFGRCARGLALLLTLAVLAGMGLGAPAAGALSAKEQYEQLEQELEELDATIDQLADQAASAAEHRAALQRQIAILREQIALLAQQIEEQQAAIVLKQQEIDAKRRELIATDALFRQRVRTLYMMRNDGVLTTVLGATSYAQALTAADTLQRITKADTQLMDLLMGQKHDLEQQEGQLQQMLAQLEADRAAMDEKLAQLAGGLQQVDKTLSEIEAQQAAAEAEYERLYQQYQDAKAAAEREFLENQGHMTEYVGGTFTWPIPGCTVISSPFGWRELYGAQDYHTGIDIIGSVYGQVYGSAVVAANDGYVTVARYGTTGYGICVYIDHGGGTITRYGHCSSLAVQAGEYVTRGQTIAYAGDSGNSTGPHLHFEVRVDGVAVDPMSYFTAA